MLRIVVCPSDKFAVGYYRLGLPAMTLQQQESGIEFHFAEGLPMLNARGEAAIAGVDEPVALHPGIDCDVLILQRPMAPYQLVALESAQKRGIRVVVEIDDHFHAVDKRSTFGSQMTADHLRIVSEACRRADLVTCTTPALARRYAPHGRVAVIPNYVPERWTEIVPFEQGPSDHAFPRVGWTGSLAAHRSDIQAAHGGVGMAMAEHGARLRAYGSGNADARAMVAHAAGVPDVEVLPWQGMDTYPLELALLKVGIAPLADIAFNRAKSWLKPLEYAACGVPCVMSPTAEYQRIHDDYGIGVLAGWRSREWKREVGKLLADESYRAEQAAQGRAAVREHLTIEDNAWKWAESWAGTLAAAI